jgi:methylenetetrahydrofolate dehydrogenase (NADP+)/methenyltetrahydrofolate cyclohydrolase
MAAQIIDGKAIAARIKEKLQVEIATLKTAGYTPHLATILVGSNAGAKVYAESQAKTSQSIGIEHSLIVMADSISPKDLINKIIELNNDPAICGIMLSMPLPKGFDAGAMQNLIASSKDVEGVGAANMGAVMQGDFTLAPCTAAAAHACIHSQNLVPVKGAEIVIVGRSAIVGKPLAMMLVWDHATVTMCHTATKDMTAHCKKADILVAAAGRANLITAEYVRSGAIVIDVGINRVNVTDASGLKKSKTVGDVDYENVASVASMITPVPGGVGPVTVAMLLKNTIEAARKNKKV